MTKYSQLCVDESKLNENWSNILNFGQMSSKSAKILQEWTKLFKNWANFKKKGAKNLEKYAKYF